MSMAYFVETVLSWDTPPDGQEAHVVARRRFLLGLWLKIEKARGVEVW